MPVAASSTEARPLLEAVGIRKEFPGTVALDGVSLTARRGEIVGLVGENGAGKSTLVKILAGIHPAGSYEGEIRLEGEPQRFGSVIDAERAGVVLIHQELAIVPALSIAENVFLNREPVRLGVVDFERMRADAAAILAELGLDVDPARPAGELSTAHQQVIEIARALAKNARVLMLDEPTSSLTTTETDLLFARLRSLRESGLCAIYISHRIDEIMEVADRVIVLRDGAVAGEDAVGELSSREIVRMMVGRDLVELFPPHRRTPGRVVLELDRWSVPDPVVPGRDRLRDVSFEVRAGEVVGLFGSVGAGRSELLLSLLGMYETRGRGGLRVDGEAVRVRTPYDAIRAGLALVTEDRKVYGLEPYLDVRRNLSLGALGGLSRFGIVDERREVELATTYVERLRVAASSIAQPVTSLSGGNQQKVILGRVLAAAPKVLFLDEPTRGIDIGAKADIYALLETLVGEGLGVVVVSSEAPEILGLADRILVLRDGTVVAGFAAGEASAQALVEAATGAAREAA